MSEENPLAFYTDDELVDELARRYERGLIVSGVRKAMGKEDEQDEERHSWYRHGLAICVGLATMMRAGMIREGLSDDVHTGE